VTSSFSLRFVLLQSTTRAATATTPTTTSASVSAAIYNDSNSVQSNLLLKFVQQLSNLLTMATLDVLLDCCTRIQQSHLQPNILAMTTSKGKITIPFAVFMSFGGISDESLLEMYMVYLRFNRDTASFILLLDMQWTKSSRGFRLHLTFDLLANLDEVRLLIQPNVPPDVPPNFDRAVVPPPAEKCNHFEPEDEVQKRVSRKKTYTKKTLYKYSIELEREIWSLIEEKQFLTENLVLRKKLLDEVVKRLNNRLKDNEIHASENDTKAVVILRQTSSKLRLQRMPGNSELL
jgi:hypothetical protein